MRDSDAFSWYMERDPLLRSTVVSVLVFDRPSRLRRAARQGRAGQPSRPRPAPPARRSCRCGSRRHAGPWTPTSTSRGTCATWRCRPPRRCAPSSSCAHRGHDRLRPGPPDVGVDAGRRARGRAGRGRAEAAPLAHRRHRRDAARRVAVRPRARSPRPPARCPKHPSPSTSRHRGCSPTRSPTAGAARRASRAATPPPCSAGPGTRSAIPARSSGAHSTPHSRSRERSAPWSTPGRRS